MEDYIKNYEPLWGSWHIDEEIGKGSFGTVYKAHKEVMGQKHIAAVKIITIPTEEQDREVNSLFDSDEGTRTEYFEHMVKNTVEEINLMNSLKGNSNIVSYEDCMLEKRPDEIRWDIIIRMEYVTPLRDYISTRQLTRAEVLKLGIDMCSALETCSKKGIIHRDIKDENIFIASDGNFKLGDFGISKELSKSGRAATRVGTQYYMAPEISKGETYDASVDIYSLGIVLYKMFNEGRFPFLPAYPQPIRPDDRDNAYYKWMSGEKFPKPTKSTDEIAEVLWKACAYNSRDRYSSPVDMKKKLISILDNMTEEEKNEKITVLPSHKSAESVKENSPAKDAPRGTVALFGAKGKTQVLSVFSESDKKDVDEEKKEPEAHDDKNTCEACEESQNPVEPVLAQDLPEAAGKKAFRFDKRYIIAAVAVACIILVGAIVAFSRPKPEPVVSNPVAAIALESIKITGEIPASGTSKLSVMAFYSDKSARDIGSGIEWKTSNPQLATVDQNGNITMIPNVYGTVSVTAVYQGKSAQISKTLTKEVTLEKIEINEKLPASGSIKLTVTAFYSDGSKKAVSSGIVWKSENKKVAVVDEKGNVEFKKGGYGNAEITAAYNGKTDTVSREIAKPKTTSGKKTTKDKKSEEPQITDINETVIIEQ